ncbi:MAG: FHA domain-containing protein [Akkermansiaceae bacterium]|nr:FHA domain-containing protein [Akkermansiaceae bacterium]
MKLVVRSAVVWLLGLGCVMGGFDPLFTSATEDDGKPPKVVFDYKLLPHEAVSKVEVKADGQDVIANLVSYTDDAAKKSAVLFLVDTSDARRGQEMLQVKKLITATLAKARDGRHNIGVYPFTGQLNNAFAPMGSSLKDVAQKVKSLEAGGKNTILYGSVIKAIAELEKVQADRKSLVVISDWQSEDVVWGAKDFTKRATKRLKDLRIVCHSIILVHTSDSELDVAEALTNVMHGQMIKVDKANITIPSSFVAGLYQDLESGGSAQIDLIGREQAKKVELSVEVEDGKKYTFTYDRTEKLNNQQPSAAEKILGDATAKVDALVKEAVEAVGKIDPASTDRLVESKKITDAAMVKVTAAVDQAKKMIADAKLTKEEADKAVSGLDKLADDAKLSFEDLLKGLGEKVPPADEEDDAASAGPDSPASTKADAKRLFGLPMFGVIGVVVAVILAIVIFVLNRKKTQHDDLGDFPISPATDAQFAEVEDVTDPGIPGSVYPKEFEFGNGTAICQTLPAASETVVAQLLFGDGGKYGVFPISKTAVRIGRGSDNDLTFKNDSVSRHHAEILCKRDGKFIVTDLDSGNGVLVNGVEVTQKELRAGDSLEVGEVCFTFSLKS